MKKTISILGLIVLLFTANAFAQLTLPQVSQKGMLTQTVGDTEVSVIYSRPNVKGRTIWGDLVPFDQIWRTGANAATIFEVSNDVMINGQKLPQGKYSLYTIPGEKEWTIMFNKSWNQPGTTYEIAEDALRVTAKPISGTATETMTFSVENVTETTANILLSWDKLRLSLDLDVGDVSGRIFSQANRQIIGTQITAANYVLSSQMTEKYSDAIGWLDDSMKIAETYDALLAKARLLGEMGKTKEAIATGEKALGVGKKDERNTGFLERLLGEWKKK